MELRTRMYPALTNHEIEQYMENNDLIFIPVGVVEAHGALPVDSETRLAEAIALKMAEVADGLVLPNLPYFFAGSTVSGRGTIEISIQSGIAYLMNIAKSLLRQGFRRQIYVTSHGPAYLTVSPMIRDFFNETKVPILYIDILPASQAIGFNLLEHFHKMTIGAYKLLGRLDDVPLQVPESNSVTYDINKAREGMEKDPANKLGKLSYQSGAIGSFFYEAYCHMPTPFIHSKEEREKLADEGILYIEELVEKLNVPEIVNTLKDTDEYVNKIALKKFSWL